MRWLEYAVFLGIVVGLARPVGLYLARVFERQRTFLDPVLWPLEALLYRLIRVQPEQEMTAPVYLICFLIFTVLGTVLLFLLLLVQQSFPGGPDSRYLTTPLSTDLAINTAVSF